MRNNYLIILAVGLTTFISFGFIQDNFDFQSYDEILKSMGGGSTIEGLPQGENTLFAGSGKCGGCHGFDPTGIAGTDSDGNDVNLVDDWRASMMANSAKDPFWRAKVSHEVAVNPAHQEALEDKCTSCHAPMGRHAAVFDGAASYSIEDMVADSLGMDGVSCGACHQMVPEFAGTTFSGEIAYLTDTIFGPYGNGEDPDIFTPPMEGLVGFTPLYDESMIKSEVCAACHTLITNTVDLDGEFTGGEFVEQATYHEWVNSVYNEDGIECQDCHMPSIDDPVVLSTNYIFLQGRTPFALHTLVGGNSFMLEMMRDHAADIDAAATEEQFDDAIDATIDQLQNNSVELVLTEVGLDDDTIYYEVALTNLTGHKFPSGYPARRAFIEFTAYDEDGNLFFKSGIMDPDAYEVEGQNSDYEPHYDMINNSDDVQIYEMVMGDVNGDVTTVLERADHTIKDNRLVPLGFDYGHFTYDTVAVEGLALDDDDFNNGGSLGSGTDWVNYHIPLDGYLGDLTVTAKLYYQSVPPKWNEEMFAVSTPEIDQFEEWYWEQGPDPVLIDSDEMTSNTVGVAEFNDFDIELFPNPSFDGKIWIAADKYKVREIDVYTADGKLVDRITGLYHSTYQLQLPEEKGLYLIQFKAGEHEALRRVIRE